MEGLAQPALRVLTVDAFTREPFSGNPAAVVFLQDDGVREHLLRSRGASIQPEGGARCPLLAYFGGGTPAVSLKITCRSWRSAFASFAL